MGSGGAVYLRPGVHSVVIGADLVLLDTESDSYLCVPNLGPDCLEGRRVVSAEARAALRNEALLTDSPRPHPYPVRPKPPIPGRACRAETTPNIQILDFVGFTGLWAKRAIQRPDIADLARTFGRRTGQESAHQALTSRVETFRNLAPAMPWIGECLFQSGLLLAFLNGAGLDATWVFGVRLRPFAAHCWLQAGDTALTDPPEALVAYHAILAI